MGQWGSADLTVVRSIVIYTLLAWKRRQGRVGQTFPGQTLVVNPQTLSMRGPGANEGRPWPRLCPARAQHPPGNCNRLDQDVDIQAATTLESESESLCSRGKSDSAAAADRADWPCYPAAMA